MCLPVLPALAIAGAVTSAAGSVMGGMQERSQERYNSQMAKRNSQMEVEAYHEERDIAGDEAQQFWRKVGATKGQQVASMAANGIDVGYGTAARIQEDTRDLAYQDAQNMYRNQQQRQRGHLINASNYTAEARAAKARGKAAMTSALFSAAGSLIGGASQAAGLKAKMGTSTAKNG